MTDQIDRDMKLQKQIIDARSILDNGGIEQYGYYRLHKLLDRMEEYIDESNDDVGGADFTRYHGVVNGFIAGVVVTVIIGLAVLSI